MKGAKPMLLGLFCLLLTIIIGGLFGSINVLGWFFVAISWLWEQPVLFLIIGAIVILIASKVLGIAIKKLLDKIT